MTYINYFCGSFDYFEQCLLLLVLSVAVSATVIISVTFDVSVTVTVAVSQTTITGSRIRWPHTIFTATDFVY